METQRTTIHGKHRALRIMREDEAPRWHAVIDTRSEQVMVRCDSARQALREAIALCMVQR